MGLKLAEASRLIKMISTLVSLLVVIGTLSTVDADPCLSVRGQTCLKRTEVKGAEWMQKFVGGDYCFKMFGSSVCLVDESKPRLVIQCDCDNPECGCLEASEKPPTEPEQEAESTTPSGPPPPSHCTSDGGYQCLTKAEIQFYFELDEVLEGGDPCFDTPFTGTKRCIIHKAGWFTNWSWDTCTCKPECGCQRNDK